MKTCKSFIPFIAVAWVAFAAQAFAQTPANEDGNEASAKSRTIEIEFIGDTTGRSLTAFDDSRGIIVFEATINGIATTGAIDTGSATPT